MPPLRTRRGDIRHLFAHFWERRGETRPVDPTVLQLLEEHPWPGNVRELENLAERLSVCAEGPVIRAGDLPAHLRPAGTNVTALAPVAACAVPAPAAEQAEVRAMLHVVAAPDAAEISIDGLHPVDLPAMLRRLEDAYADFITLLFAFFVVMYSVSRVDNKRLTQAANSIQWALHFAGSGGNGQMPIFDAPATETLVDMGRGSSTPPPVQPEAIRKRIQERLAPLLGLRAGSVGVSVEGKMLTVRLTASAFFDPGQAAIRPDALPILDAIADELVPLERPLRVEGHTDDVPVQGARYHDNWELSAMRAATVVSYVQRAHGARADQLSATGLGASRPIAEGTGAQARDANRRVEIVAELGELEPARRR